MNRLMQNHERKRAEEARYSIEFYSQTIEQKRSMNVSQHIEALADLVRKGRIRGDDAREKTLESLKYLQKRDALRNNRFTDIGTGLIIPAAWKLEKDSQEQGRFFHEVDVCFYKQIREQAEQISARVSSGRIPRAGVHLADATLPGRYPEKWKEVEAAQELKQSTAHVQWLLDHFKADPAQLDALNLHNDK